MTSHRSLIGLAAASGLACLVTCAPAAAQSWPSRPMTMVVPFAAGGGADVMGRIVAARLSELLGQQVLVENAGGAGGMTGAYRVAKAAPDGYQFVLGTNGTHAQNQSLYKNPLYNAATDFAPVALIAEQPIALLTRKDLPADNLQEFVAYAKANQAQMAMQDLIAGRIDYQCANVAPALGQIESRQVKAIALLSAHRSVLTPDLPTADEQGLKDFDAIIWYALFLPKDTPAAIVRQLNAATIAAMNTSAVQERMKQIGADLVAPERRSSEYLSKLVESEIAKWAGPIKASGVTAD